ncbi:EexN family lipoprotein [Campylobacter sp. MIT 21-1685]|uniref:EexN family lipoprotein n=1 Tax=unclassified Campylobacter TaxID=2593542 RepID=UPI00224B10A9|nr:MULTISPECIES: EexN family lipoprotein [unclassified Campylobacter]MCX2682352.1 EexN family lipoprotein [Campylobacter sp. MIT 21-1684]MCX2750632.1 EexN family lipoprotein [Campylobacter sp. MIT 21-1682]MCX2806820.1 EexN family lipoprotein [Campylobacter sp. MIT 21-1685]
MKVQFFILGFLLLFLNACEQTKSVQYYQEHPEEAKERSLECRDKAIISQDCINAYTVGFPKDEDETEEE